MCRKKKNNNRTETTTVTHFRRDAKRELKKQFNRVSQNYGDICLSTKQAKRSQIVHSFVCHEQYFGCQAVTVNLKEDH